MMRTTPPYRQRGFQAARQNREIKTDETENLFENYEGCWSAVAGLPGSVSSDN
jgi:hypothetical protein